MRFFWVLFGFQIVLFSACKESTNSIKEIDNSISKDSIQVSPVEATATKSLKSTVMIIMEDNNHQELSYGSGVIIDDNKIATNRHVIENAYYGKVKKYGSDTTYSIKQVLAIDNSNDLAILEVSNLQKELDIQFDTIKPNIGKKVYAVGNPKGLEGTFSEGIVSGIRNFKDSSELIQISAPISPGSSGGQIIDEKNRIIGIAVGGIVDGQNLNFAIPSKYLISLMSQSQNPINLSNVKGSKTTKKGQKQISQSKDEIVIKNLDWLKDGGYDPYGLADVNSLIGFSIYNSLENSISNIKILFILYDRDNTPVDYSYITVYESIPPKLAKKITNISSTNSVYAENYMNSAPIKFNKKRGYKCIVRVLDFSINDR